MASSQDYHQQYYAPYYQPPGSYGQSYQQQTSNALLPTPTQSSSPFNQTSSTAPQKNTLSTTEHSTSGSETPTAWNNSWWSQTSAQWPQGNAQSSQANTQSNQTNTAWSQANAITTPWSQANTSNTAWSQANTTNTAWSQANTANTANTAWSQANTANTAWSQANTASTAWSQANATNTPWNQANTAWSQANPTNTAWSQAGTQWAQANPQWPPQQWNGYGYPWTWGAWPPPPIPWLPPPGQMAWAGHVTDSQQPRSKSPGTPPLPDQLEPEVKPSEMSREEIKSSCTVGQKHPRPEDNEVNPIEEKRLCHDNDPPPQQQQNQTNKEKWPPKMKEYVTRAFGACTNEEEREYVHQVLDEELNRFFAENKQWSIDWDTYPLPTERIRKARSSSRWDTPSPTAELSSDSTPTLGGTLSVGRGRGHGRGWSTGETLAVGRGRGKKVKKNKKVKKWGAVLGGSEDPSPEDQKRLTERAQRFGKQGTTEGNKNFKKKISIDELLKRNQPAGGDDGLVYWQDTNLEGTCQNLEKQYLRLTSAPEPSTVRPLHVLKRSLEHVCAKWTASKDYHYACEQFKSIRQDLTIQAIRNNFTVSVYETHGRVALENGDHQEFNQCQTQLKSLYSEGLSGQQAEFLAYRILYYILTDSSADMSSALLEINSELRCVPCVKHALGVWSAWSLGNYHRMFHLYQTAPNLSGALMKLFLERERRKALQVLARAYRPSLSVEYISSELVFSSHEECLEFLTGLGAVLDPTNTTLDCKLTVGKL